MTPLRLAVIGCGRVFERFHLPALRSNRRWRIEAVADPSGSRRDWARVKIPGASIYPSSEALLDACRPDAILIASPPAVQPDLAIQALSAGADVLVEKPCGLSAEDARRMASAAEAHGRHLRVGFNRRFHDSYISLKQAMKGAPKTRWSLVFRLGFSVEDWSAHSGYLGKDDVGGGVLHDVVSHQLDVIHWVLPGALTSIQAHFHHRLPLQEELRYAVELADGTRAECLARHGIGYLETLLARDAENMLLAFPTGFLRGAGHDDRALARAANRKAWLGRKLIRVGFRHDRMLRSYEGQLSEFADLVGGRGDGGSLATVSDAVWAHDGTQALRRTALELLRTPAPGESSERARTRLGSRHADRSERPVATPQQAPAGGAANVSVILVAGNQRQRAADALRSVLAQGGIAKTEVLLVDLGDSGLPPLEGSEHPSVRQWRMGSGSSYGEARAEAVHRARGDVVAFLEEHSRVAPGWLPALVARFAQGPWVAVGPRVVSGNPNSGFSDAMGLINYGAWTEAQMARETDMLPGNNSAYRRQALLDLGPELGRLLLADTVLQWRLMEEGGRLFMEPQAILSHRYPTSLWSAAKGEYLYHVCFADVRARSFGWSWPMRLVYAAGSFLIPWLRLARMLKASRESESGGVLRRNVLGVLLLLCAAVVGQAVGVLVGSRGTERRFTDYELNEPRPTRGEDASRR